MFGCEAKVGLTSSSLPDEVIQRMQCEDDLLAVLTTGQNGEEPGPVPSAESAEVHFDTERPSPSVVPNTSVPVRLVSAEVHVDAERGHHPSVDSNHPVPFRSQTAEVDIDAERGCHQSIVSSTQREISPAVSQAVTLVNPGASPENDFCRRENKYNCPEKRCLYESTCPG